MPMELRALFSRLRGTFTRTRPDRELGAEIEEHLRLLTERFVRQGLSEHDARRAARIQFGGLAQIQEDLHDQRGLPLIENVGREVAYSLRMIRRQPGFSLLIIAILALGLGADTAIFSLVNAILLHPLRFPHAENLVALYERTGGSDNPVAPANYLEWQDHATMFDRLAAISYARLTLSGVSDSSDPERIDVCASSASLFDTLGVKPLIGRSYEPDEDRPGAPPVVVISYDLWQRHFRQSVPALGTVIKLDSRPYTVIGVMPRDFTYPARSIGAWIPLQAWLPPVVLQSRDNHLLTVIGRLRSADDIARANAEIDGIFRRYQVDHFHEGANGSASLKPLAEVEVAGVRKLLLFLCGSVGCVLLIACVNVANLLLSRAAGRRREVAIRAALGAARSRIVRQLIVESVVLFLVGGTVGTVLAVGLVGRLTAWAPAAAWLPLSVNIRVDPSIFFFGAAMALLCGMVAGIVPALQSSSSLNLGRSLTESGRTASAGRSHNRFRDILLAAEVALSLILLIAAGLLIRSFGRLVSADLGLQTSDRLTMRLSLPDARYHERIQVASFLKQFSAQLQSIPGVMNVGMTSCPALVLPGFCPDTAFQIEPAPLTRREMDAQYRGVSPEFFRATGIPILRGRSFGSSDGIGVDDQHPLPGAAVINQALARRFFASEDPIGRFIRLDWFVGNNTERSVLRYRIIGIAGDVRERPQAAPQPTIYLPLLDGDSTDISIVMQTAGVDGDLAGAARSVLHRMDPDLPLFGIQPMSELRSETTRDREFTMMILAVFAAFAVVLAAIGLYGVVSWSVSQGAKEIAIRIALGATSREVQIMVLGRGLRPAVFGIAIGAPCAAVLGRLSRGLLFEIHPIDSLTFTLVPLMLLGVTVLAAWLPAIRATRVDPTIGLRVD